MSQHVEWLNVENALPRAFPAGVEIGENETERPAIVFGFDDLVVIEGDVNDLRIVLSRALGKLERLAQHIIDEEESAIE